MTILTPGHKYIAANFENPQEGQTIQFIEKDAQPGQKPLTINDGTTNEELIEVLVNRLQFLNEKFPCRENSLAITHLHVAQNWLERRTRLRMQRGVEGKQIL